MTRDLHAWLASRASQGGIRYDLTHFVHFLQTLKDPHLHLPPSILIAGTNGKGSTLTYIAAVLLECGYSVGTYTSPHLQSYTERFCLNGQPISDAQLTAYLQKVLDTPESETLTEFELLTAVSFLYFTDIQPDFVLYEVGLGGRLDATNVISQTLSIITQVGYDHQAILGESLTQIAGEKAGIIEASVPTLTLTTQPNDVLTVIRTVSKTQGSRLIEVSPRPHIPVHYAMQGAYQKDNLALAQAALSFLNLPKIPPKVMDSGLAKAQIWGRYLIQKTETQTRIIDAAHNEMGARALIEQLQIQFPNQRPTFLLSFYAPKNAPEMLSLFLKAGDVLYTEFDPELAYPFQKLRERFLDQNLRFIPFDELSKAFPEVELLVVSGSIYFIGKVGGMLT